MHSTPIHALGRVAAIVAFVAAALVVTGPPPPASAALPPDLWAGTTADFYVVPDPLPSGQPGDIIRLQLISQTGGATTLRVMYHSRDVLDRDRAVTGIVTYPDATPPPGGWPVVSTANGTSGMQTNCALSRYNQPASTWGIQGVGVNTDYIGLGPVGELHPYLSRVSEAHSVIDAVRAARNITETGAGNRWLAIGGSQGGHAAISTNELAESWAPELDLVGTVALAPGAMFANTYSDLDEIIARVISVMMLYGGATEHPELIPTDYAGPQTAAAADAVLPTGCLNEITAALVVIPADTYWLHDPRVTEPAHSIMLANDVGNVASPSPLLVVQGTADTTVDPRRTRDLLDPTVHHRSAHRVHRVRGRRPRQHRHRRRARDRGVGRRSLRRRRAHRLVPRDRGTHRHPRPTRRATTSTTAAPATNVAANTTTNRPSARSSPAECSATALMT